jgi:hypothetical protein
MEGAEREFIAADKGHDRLFLLIRSPSNAIPPPIRAVVDRRQLVDSIYTGFTRFAKSELYVEEEWAFFSVGDRLGRRLPSLGPEQSLATAAQLDKNTLCTVLSNVAPTYVVTFAGEETLEDGFRRWLKYVLHPDDKDAGKGLIETPDEWELPEDFDDWSANRRKEYLREMLQEHANSWLGYKLDELSSRIIEKYLGWRNGQPRRQPRAAG